MGTGSLFGGISRCGCWLARSSRGGRTNGRWGWRGFCLEDFLLWILSATFRSRTVGKGDSIGRSDLVGAARLGRGETGLSCSEETRRRRCHVLYY